jgi:hypothetical protein
MAIVLTSMYDAWAAYDDKAVGTRLGTKLRRPKVERTLKNKETAIAYAAFRSLLNVYPEDVTWIRGQMKKMGYNPDLGSKYPRSPAGIGNAAASAVIIYRQHDGANQLGDERGGVRGEAYSDYTFYHPKNSPNNIVDPTSWLPIPFSDGKGGTVSSGFLSPYWYRVMPFILEFSDQFRPPPPPMFGSDQLKRDVEEVLAVNAGLTLEQKAIVEFMREGPHSTGQSGHWLQFAQDISRRYHYDLDHDVKLFFAVSNVVADAFIACWDSKRFYDTSRPYWWVRFYHQGEKLRGWKGAGKGIGTIKAEEWRPYSPDVFLTPPFPGYVSGHATASGAASLLMKLITGSDELNEVAILNVGELTEAKFSTAEMQAVDGEPAKDVQSTKEIRVKLPTLSATAEMAALSRLWGGYHIRTDNEQGLMLGRKIAIYSWPKFQAYFNGTATVPKN